MTPEVLPALDFGAALSFPLAVSVSPTILALAFALVVAFWAVMTVIYMYHWRRFPYGKEVLRKLERVYLIVSSVIIVLALGGMFAL